MKKIREENGYRVYIHSIGLYWVVDEEGNIALKTNSIQEYRKFISRPQ